MSRFFYSILESDSREILRKITAVLIIEYLRNLINRDSRLWCENGIEHEMMELSGVNWLPSEVSKIINTSMHNANNLILYF